MWINANAHPFRDSTAVAGVAYLALLTLVGAAGRLNAEVAGRLFANALLPALVIGFIAQQASSRWRWWTYGLAVFGGVVLAFLITTLSTLQGTT